VLAFLREDGEDCVLCVNNLSKFPQPVELHLYRFQGWTPVELRGGINFPTIGDRPYVLTLPGYGFYWFQLRKPADGEAGAQAGAQTGTEAAA